MATGKRTASRVLLLVLAAPLTLAAGPSLPKYISICKQNDANLNDCFLKSAKATLPHIVDGDALLKIPKLDPFRIQELKIDQSGQSTVGLDLSFKDIDIIGLKDTDIRHTNFDLEKFRYNFEMLIPKLSVVGPYEVSGKVLILPIKGKGNSNITLGNVNFIWSISGKLMGKTPSTQRLHITEAVAEIEPESMTINMEGLFGGDKALGDQMNIFLNENWREVLGELKGALNEALAQIVHVIGNQVISSVPFNQILPPK